MSILVLGTAALDTVRTPSGARREMREVLPSIFSWERIILRR
jgi:hypothetical protein